MDLSFATHHFDLWFVPMRWWDLATGPVTATGAGAAVAVAALCCWPLLLLRISHKSHCVYNTPFKDIFRSFPKQNGPFSPWRA